MRSDSYFRQPPDAALLLEKIRVLAAQKAKVKHMEI